MPDHIKSILTDIPKHLESHPELLLLLLSQQVTSSKLREPQPALTPCIAPLQPFPAPCAALTTSACAPLHFRCLHGPHTQVFTQQPPAMGAVTQAEGKRGNKTNNF